MMLLVALATRAAGAAPILEWALDADDGGFVATGDTGQWHWGEVRNGPGSGFDGPRAWSTGLTANYLNDSVDELEIPLPDLSLAVHPVLRFEAWYQTAAPDGGWIEVDSGGGWELATPIYGYPQSAGYVGSSGGWQEVAVDLADAGATPRIRLVFATDVAGVGEGWFIDRVGIYDGDVAAPHITAVTTLADTEDIAGPYVVEAEISDDNAVATAELLWNAAGVDVVTPMTRGTGDTWRGEIAGQSPNTTVRYAVRADDGENAASFPSLGTQAFRVFLPAPSNLDGPDGRVVAGQARLTWSPPDTAHSVVGYRVFRGASTLLDVRESYADVPLLGAYDTFSVRALYDLDDDDPVAGDAADDVSVDAVVPAVVSLDPDGAYAGDTVHVTVHARYLLMTDGKVALSLGQGVTVNRIDVIDVDTLLAEVSVSPDTTPGPRTVSVVTDTSFAVEPEAFTIMSGADRPRLTTLEPSSIRQGQSGEIEIAFVGSLAAPPVVDLGSGVVIESVSVGSGTIRVVYACALDSAIGTRAVRVDDGVRVLTGVTLKVKDFARPSMRSCGVEAPMAGWLGALLASTAARFRRRKAHT